MAALLAAIPLGVAQSGPPALLAALDPRAASQLTGSLAYLPAEGNFSSRFVNGTSSPPTEWGSKWYSDDLNMDSASFNTMVSQTPTVVLFYYPKDSTAAKVDQHNLTLGLRMKPLMRSVSTRVNTHLYGQGLSERPNVRFVSIDVHVHQNLRNYFGVKAVPSIFYYPGKGEGSRSSLEVLNTSMLTLTSYAPSLKSEDDERVLENFVRDAHSRAHGDVASRAYEGFNIYAGYESESSKEAFDQITAEEPTVVLFYSPDNPASLKSKDAMFKVAKKVNAAGSPLGKRPAIRFAMLDAKKHAAIRAAYGVTSYPTINYYPGKGSLSRAQVEQFQAHDQAVYPQKLEVFVREAHSHAYTGDFSLSYDHLNVHAPAEWGHRWNSELDVGWEQFDEMVSSTPSVVLFYDKSDNESLLLKPVMSRTAEYLNRYYFGVTRPAVRFSMIEAAADDGFGKFRTSYGISNLPELRYYPGKGSGSRVDAVRLNLIDANRTDDEREIVLKSFVRDSHMRAYERNTTLVSEPKADYVVGCEGGECSGQTCPAGFVDGRTFHTKVVLLGYTGSLGECVCKCFLGTK